MELLSVGGGGLAVERDPTPSGSGHAFIGADYTSVQERVNQSLRV
jgi:hypothetical protein